MNRKNDWMDCYKPIKGCDIEFDVQTMLKSYKEMTAAHTKWEEPIKRPDYDYFMNQINKPPKTHIETAFDKARQKLKEKHEASN